MNYWDTFRYDRLAYFLLGIASVVIFCVVVGNL